MAKIKTTTKDGEAAELLRHVEAEDLHHFIASYAGGNKAFKNSLFAHFRPKEPQKTISEYRSAAASCFEFGRTGRYTRNYNFYQGAYEAELALYSLLQKGKYLATQNNLKEAAAVAQATIETIPRFYETVDDSSGGLVDLFNDATNLLLTIVENEKAGKLLKVEIFQWVGKEVKEKIYSDYGFDEIESLLIPCTLAAGMINEALAIADERIGLATDDHQLEATTMDMIRLLEKAGMPGEMMVTINENLRMHNVRRLKVDILLEQGHNTAAILLIKDGIRLAEQNNLPGLVSDWKNQLLHLYTAMKDHPGVLKLAEDLFYNGLDSMKYYAILKQQTPRADWTACVEKMLNGMKRGSSGYTRAQIFIEEKYWDRLLQLVKSYDLHQLEDYEEYLKPHYPAELLNLFAQKITDFGEKNMGRKHYKYVAEIITKLRVYPNGNKIADMLVANFRVKYKARKAMIEELNGV